MQSFISKDEILARVVMGWRSFGDCWSTGPTAKERVIKKNLYQPSKNLKQALEVATRFDLRLRLTRYEKGLWTCAINGGFEFKGECEADAVSTAIIDYFINRKEKTP